MSATHNGLDSDEHIADLIDLLLARDPIILEEIDIFEDILKNFFQVQLYGGNEFGPLILTPGQRALLELFFEMIRLGVPIRIIILKARQLGISCLIGAILTILMFMRPNLRCAVAAHEKEGSSEHIYDYYLTFLRLLPKRLEHLSKKRNERGGHRLLATSSFIACEHEKEIRGRAMDYLHLSEAAYYKDLPKFMGAVSPTIPETAETGIFMETTAQAYDDDFHRRWKRAEEGDDIFKPIFLGWYLHPNYRHEFNSDQEKRDFELSISKNEHPRWGNEQELLDLEGVAVGNVHYKIELENLKWRRWKLNSITLLDFYKEYPSYAEEAFLHTDKNVFDPIILKWYHEKDVSDPILEGEMDIDKPNFQDKSPLFINTKPGIIKVKEEPDPDGEYIYGIDTSRGKDSYCSLQVLKRRPFMQVAVLRGFEGRNMIPLQFAEQAFQLWKWYGEGFWAIENNDAGVAVIDSLLNWGATGIMTHDALLPNSGEKNKDYGWNKNPKTEVEMVEKLRYQILNKTLRIFDIETIREMNQYIYKKTEGTGVSEGSVRAMAKRKGQNRKPGDSEIGFYDDRVIALGSAVLAHLALSDPKSKREVRIEQDQTDHDILYPELSNDLHDGLGFGFDAFEGLGHNLNDL